MKRILLTGGAGFIGGWTAAALLRRGDAVHVLDNLDPFYDPALKHRNLDWLTEAGGERFSWAEGDIRDPAACAAAVRGVDAVVHLAALAGVRPSIEQPARYMDVNVTGTQVLLDAVRDHEGLPFVFGSSSSVYGGNTKVPFAETDPVDRPVSPYAASKKAGEVVCHVWHHLTGNPVTCLRFFTVYGPRQRPEMAIAKFTRCIADGAALPFFGDGSSVRDYTYVDDIVAGVLAALDRADGYRIYNLGGAATTSLKDLVAMIESAVGKKAVLDRQPDQAGDVPRTWADTTRSERELGWHSEVPIADGVRRFVSWYLGERAEGRLR